MQKFNQFIPGAEPTNNFKKILSPYNQEEIAEIEKSNADGMEQALKNAKSTFYNTMKSMPAWQRAEILYAVADKIKANLDELALTIAKEGGKPFKDAKVEAARAVNTVKMSGDEALVMNGENLTMDRSKGTENHIAFTMREGIGPVLAISAFNHPLNLIAHQMATAFAAGNSVIVKPASQTPISCFRMAEFFKEAGVPDGVINICYVSGGEAGVLVKDHRIKFITFIGGEDVGWRMRGECAPGTRMTLEHGGTGTSILDETADLSIAIPKIIKGGFYHAGQVCVSTQNLHIHESRYEDIISMLIEEIKKLKTGDPSKPDTDVGPLITSGDVKRVDEWIKEAVAAGAKVRIGGKPLENNCFEPTLISDVNPDMKIVCKEVFGPVLNVKPYSNISDVISELNESPYSFQASIYTKDVDKAFACARKIETKAFMINDSTAFRVDWMPFGGNKESGLGVGGVKDSIHEMSTEKLIVMNVNPIV